MALRNGLHSVHSAHSHISCCNLTSSLHHHYRVEWRALKMNMQLQVQRGDAYVDEPFTIYRPETTTGRLEGTYHVDGSDVWRPSMSYKHTLKDIKNQFTPAENFRHRLATSGKYIRMIQHLEIRMNRHHGAFLDAAVKIQSRQRGIAAREYFELRRAELQADLRRRQLKAKSTVLFHKGLFEEAIYEIDQNLPSTVTILEIKMKCQYRLKLYEECIETTQQVIEMNEFCEEAYYIQASSHLCRGDNDAAYRVMKSAAIQLETPSRNTLKMCAYIAVRIMPPRFMEAIDSLGSILKRNPQDFEVLLERASCYFCLQEWAAGIKDLCFILVFVPVHVKALLMRARANACIREWAQARADYNTILSYQPGHPLALQGLEDIEETIIVLPMLGDALIENEST